MVNRDRLWLLLLSLGVPVNVVQLGLLIGCSKAGIRIKRDIVANFALNTGLKQGSMFSPLLFNIFFGAIIDAWRVRLKDMGIELRFKIGSDIFDVKALKKKAETECMTLSESLFADDAFLCGATKEELRIMLSSFYEVSSAFGQSVSLPKYIVATLKKCEKDLSGPYQMVVNGEVIEVAKEF